MKSQYSILFIMLLMLSCTDEDSNSTAQTVLDNDVAIYLQDPNGADLFETPGFESANFKTFYVLDGVAVHNNEPHLDYPGHFVMWDMVPNRMLLFINRDADEAFPQTIVKWNDVESDTLKAQYQHGLGESESYSRCEKLWLNEVLVWDGTVEGQIAPRQITIVK